MLQTAAGGSAAAVRRVYEALLSRGRGGGSAAVVAAAAGGGAMDAQLGTPRMRVQLLRSAVVACGAALLDVQSAAGPLPAPPPGLLPGLAAAAVGGGAVARAREAGALADAADRCVCGSYPCVAEQEGRSRSGTG